MLKYLSTQLNTQLYSGANTQLYCGSSPEFPEIPYVSHEGGNMSYKYNIFQSIKLTLLQHWYFVYIHMCAQFQKILA